MAPSSVEILPSGYGRRRPWPQPIAPIRLAIILALVPLVLANEKGKYCVGLFPRPSVQFQCRDSRARAGIVQWNSANLSSTRR